MITLTVTELIEFIDAMVEKLSEPIELPRGSEHIFSGVLKILEGAKDDYLKMKEEHIALPGDAVVVLPHNYLSPYEYWKGIE